MVPVPCMNNKTSLPRRIRCGWGIVPESDVVKRGAVDWPMMVRQRCVMQGVLFCYRYPSTRFGKGRHVNQRIWRLVEHIHLLTPALYLIYICQCREP